MSQPNKGGRPRKNPKDRKKQRSLYCKDEIYEEIVKFAESKGRTFSDFLIYAALIEMSSISQEKLLKRVAELTLAVNVTHAIVTAKSKRTGAAPSLSLESSGVRDDTGAEGWAEYQEAKKSGNAGAGVLPTDAETAVSGTMKLLQEIQNSALYGATMKPKDKN